MANPHPLPPPARTPALHVMVEYLGFRTAPGRREYLLRVKAGQEARDYTVWIAESAFATRQALLQDGPDICYQKLRRELAVSALDGGTCLGVTEGDLASYREAHAPPTRRPLSSPPVSVSSPTGRDGSD